MKVFLSWSGEKSHKVAIVFRDWLPAVIQSLEPYVSSEDIDKGARWSTDIAKELDDSSFGILCVTKQNIDAPWLTFEAGALSKTMDKSFVSPFLFDIKRSEVNGPILQFQSTVFEKDDVEKLIKTLNRACGEGQLKDGLLTKAFDVWWPTLEEKLNEIGENDDKVAKIEDDAALDTSAEILEEILDLSRMNQKLLRNPESDISSYLKMISVKIEELSNAVDREKHFRKRRIQKFHPGMMREMLIGGPRSSRYVGFQMVLSIYKEEFPWIYDAGIDLIKSLNSRISKELKQGKLKEFMDLVDFTSSNPITREMFGMDKGAYSFMREMPFLFHEAIEILDTSE
jgi:TIR domain